jgi:hypothetical protein
MEVLVALAVFLLAFVALGRLVIIGSDRALDAQYEVRAADLCQTKIAEVIAGAISLSPQREVPFPEDGRWRWSLDCTKENAPGLWNVTLQVSRQQPQGSRVFCSITQWVLDPQSHGSLQDTPPDTGALSDVPSTGSSSSPSGGPSSPGGAAGTARGGS